MPYKYNYLYNIINSYVIANSLLFNKLLFLIKYKDQYLNLIQIVKHNLYNKIIVKFNSALNLNISIFCGYSPL